MAAILDLTFVLYSRFSDENAYYFFNFHLNPVEKENVIRESLLA